MSQIDNNLFGADEYILSHILSHLKIRHIIPLQSVCSQWKNTISKFYFFQDFKEFFLDRYFDEYFSWRNTKHDHVMTMTNTSLDSNYGNSSGSIRNEDAQIWHSKMIKKLSHFLVDLKRKFAPIESVKVMNLFEDFGLNLKLVKSICDMFPSIELFRISFSESDSGKFIEVVTLLARSLKNLKEIQIVYCSDVWSTDESSVECKGHVHLSLLKCFEKLKEIFPSVSITIVDSLSIYTSSYNSHLNVILSAVREAKQNRQHQQKPPRGGNSLEYYNLTEPFSSDEELLQYLHENAWILKFQNKSKSILPIAIHFNFTESVKYILEQQPDLLYRNPTHTQTVMEMIFDKRCSTDLLLQILSTGMIKLYEKSDLFISEEIPKLFNSNLMNVLNPLQFLCNATGPIEMVMNLYGSHLLRDKILKHQTGLSVHHYILLYFSDDNYLLNFIGRNDWDLDRENPAELLSTIASIDHYSIFNRVTTEWKNFQKVLESNYEILDECNQNILHKLFERYCEGTGGINGETKRKYYDLRELCPGISKLLLQPDILGYPIEGLITKRHYIRWSFEFMEELVGEMKIHQPIKTNEIIKSVCMRTESFTVLYAFLKMMGGIEFLQVEDLNFALSWTGTHRLKDEEINRQYYEILSEGYINVVKTNSQKQTVLHQIADAGIDHSCLYIFLTAFGCDVDALDMDGCVASHYCSPKNQYLLKRMGADPNIWHGRKRYSFNNRRGRNTTGYSRRKIETVVVCSNCLKYFTSKVALDQHKMRVCRRR